MTAWMRGSYLLHGVARREMVHRRAVALGIALLLVASAGPVFGHHFTDAFEWMNRGRDHLGALCLVALQQLLSPVHEGFHVLLGLGVAYAVLDRLRAFFRLRRTLSSLSWTAPVDGDVFHVAATVAGVDPSRIRVVRRLPAPAFTAGMTRPTIFVAAELGATLTDRELAAVLAHEGAHAVRRDPLRLSLVRFLARTLFWLPAVQQLAEDFGDEAEVEADDAAARLAQPSSPLVLASALVTTATAFAVADASPLRDYPVAGLSSAVGSDLLGRRVRRLAGEDAPVRTHLTRRGIVMASGALVLVWVSSLAMDHPANASVQSSHCAHETGFVLSHLLCQEGGGMTAGLPCIHDGK